MEQVIKSNMKVLWFTNTPSNYKKGSHSYHGGGWMESLEVLINSIDSIELAISFFHNSDNKKVVENKTTYYPIKKSESTNPINKLIRNWSDDSKKNHAVIQQLVEVVEDFSPDVIHVFGSEGVFSEILEEVNVPVVIHLQGLLNPYYNTYFPINQSKWNFIFNPDYLKNNLFGNSPIFFARKMKNRAKREAKYLKTTKYVMGRTKWDYLIAKHYNPNVNYFLVNEVLRSGFYEEKDKQYDFNNEVKILSTISSTIYKGIDVILNTAKLLSENTTTNFVWNIAGLKEGDKLWNHYEKSLKINHKNVKVNLIGVKSSQELLSLMNTSNLFIHPSYIDNSPNSVCEAQILGVPIIACNVGGVSSLIEDGKTGFLVPANGTFEIADHIINFSKTPEKYIEVGKQGRKSAQKRHNRQEILSSLLDCYSKIYEECSI